MSCSSSRDVYIGNNAHTKRSLSTSPSAPVRRTSGALGTRLHRWSGELCLWHRLLLKRYREGSNLSGKIICFWTPDRVSQVV